MGEQPFSAFSGLKLGEVDGSECLGRVNLIFFGLERHHVYHFCVLCLLGFLWRLRFIQIFGLVCSVKSTRRLGFPLWKVNWDFKGLCVGC